MQVQYLKCDMGIWVEQIKVFILYMIIFLKFFLSPFAFQQVLLDMEMFKFWNFTYKNSFLDAAAQQFHEV